MIHLELIGRIARNRLMNGNCSLLNILEYSILSFEGIGTLALVNKRKTLILVEYVGAFWVYKGLHVLSLFLNTLT